MFLGSLVRSAKKHKKIPVNGISFDSRKVKKGNIFFAIRGNKTSGEKFINDAIKKGAKAIISEKKIEKKKLKVPIILVKDSRKALSEACSKYYKYKPKNIIAVTGTNGKSSVANFFYQILSLNNISTASIGTLGVASKSYNKKTNLTSLYPISLHKNLKILKQKKIEHVILEASSHGLKQKRLDGLNINIGIFTNLSHDHLDYHKNKKSYLNSKMYLFEKLLKKKAKIITDEEIKEFKVIKKIAKKRKINQLTIGIDKGSIKILSSFYRKDRQIVKVLFNSKAFTINVPLIGDFQLKNLFMAVLAASCLGIKIKKIFKQLHKIKAVPGRLECVAKLKNNSMAMIDFAHTPEALEKILLTLKEQFRKKIILVFGCGGERDKKKRFTMGNIASKYCRKIFVTDDNPRNENPNKIRNSIIKACKKIAVDIGSRKKAIENGIIELRPNEILLVAGKGHEQTQDYGNKILTFSDKKVIKNLISKKKLR